MNPKVKPTLLALLIPIILFITAIAVGSTLIMDPIQDMMNIETKDIGEEFRFDAVKDKHQLVYVALEEGAVIEKPTVDGAITTVVVDVNGTKTSYMFELTYYGTAGAEYEIYEYPQDTTMNNLRLLFSYTFTEEGSYGVVGTSDNATEYSVNEMSFNDLFMGILMGIFAGIGIGVVGIVSLIVILVMRGKSRRFLAQETEQYNNKMNPINNKDLYE